jgi:hypothetical protein
MSVDCDWRGAEDDCFVGAHDTQVQDRAGACEQKKRTAIESTAAQMGNQGLLAGLIQPLFNHANDQDGRIFDASSEN